MKCFLYEIIDIKYSKIVFYSFFFLLAFTGKISVFIFPNSLAKVWGLYLLHMKCVILLTKLKTALSSSSLSLSNENAEENEEKRKILNEKKILCVEEKSVETPINSNTFLCNCVCCNDKENQKKKKKN